MSKEKILVVEDEEAIQELIRYNLNKDGYDRVRCCDSGETALAAARAVPEVARALEGKTVVKEIVVPDKLVNLVAK